MTDAIKIALITAVLNGAVMWGVVSTKLDWMRKDLDKIENRTERLEGRK
jgi:hypothetical protein